MRRVREVIVVEGRYDKNALRQVVDATVVETRGFGIFNDRERLALLRRLAEERGLILLTDSDGAGFVIRNFLKGAIPKDRLKQAYIPDVYGKERRKAAPGREGKLGVEGMNPGVLLQALERAGATFEEERPAEAIDLDASITGVPGEADKYWPVPVTTGISDAKQVEIISGVEAGDMVFINYTVDPGNGMGGGIMFG